MTLNCIQLLPAPPGDAGTQARIKRRGCDRKGIRRKTCAPNQKMNQADFLCQDMARAYPGGDARGHCRTLVRNGRRLPYQERIRLKKEAQRWKRRIGERKPVVKIGTLNVGSMTGRGQELVDLMERRKVKIMCLQETK